VLRLTGMGKIAIAPVRLFSVRHIQFLSFYVRGGASWAASTGGTSRPPNI
jgi:hypothetical protein